MKTSMPLVPLQEAGYLPYVDFKPPADLAERDPHVIDFTVPPDGRGIDWLDIVCLQAHLVVSALIKKIKDLIAENAALRAGFPVCDICDRQPCESPSFCATCRSLDRRRGR
jgi:hypothetical protein